MSIDFPSKEDEIKHINTQLYQCEVQIQQIMSHRPSLLRRLNDLQSSDNIFPNEIMSAIFVQACLPNGQDDKLVSSPFVLGAVCSRWRQIMWNEPSLWTSVGPIPPNRPVRSSDVVRLRLHFQNAGTRPISLNLRLDCLPPRQRNTRDLLRTVFGENSARIRNLTFSPTNLDKTWSMVIGAISRSHFPNLSTFSLVGRRARYSPIHPRLLPTLFDTATQIRTLSFRGYTLPNREEPFWARVTVLQLTKLPIDQCIRLLPWCLSLVEYYCSQSTGSGATIMCAPETLHNLEVFDVDWCLPHRWRYGLFTRLRFPNLKCFRWYTYDSPIQDIRSNLWGPFFGTMSSLVELTYGPSQYNQFDLQDILPFIGSSIRIVHLPYPPDDWSLISTALTCLGGPPGTLKTLELRLPCKYIILRPQLQYQASELCRMGLDLKLSQAHRCCSHL